jgi:hypothetical protein
MFRSVKTWLSITLPVLIVSTVLFTACTSSPSVKSIVDGAIKATNEVKSYKSVVSMGLTTEVTGSETPMKVTMGLDGMVFTDASVKQTHMILEVVLTDTAQGEQNLSWDAYLSSEWQYVKVPKSESGEEWVKVKVSGGAEAAGQLAQHVGLLKTAAKLKLVDSEVIDGEDCYVVEMTPDAISLIALLLGQAQTHFTMGLKSSDFTDFDLAKVVKNITFKEWISKRNHLVRKSAAEIVMEMKPEDVSAEAGDFEKLDLRMNMGVTFLGYDEPVEVTPPQEALDAPEMTIQ